MHASVNYITLQINIDCVSEDIHVQDAFFISLPLWDEQSRLGG